MMLARRFLVALLCLFSVAFTPAPPAEDDAAIALIGTRALRPVKAAAAGGAPTLTSVVVNGGFSVGDIDGGYTATLTGTNFTGATGTTFGGSTCTSPSVASTTITCTVPAHATGTVSVIVTTPSGSNAANSAFRYSSPAELVVNGWWRAIYAGSPWTPTASAGFSGTNGNLTEATNPPSVGAAVNAGLTPASFDAVNDVLSGSTLNTYLSTTTWSMWAIVYVNAIVYPNATSIWQGDPIVGDSTSFVGIYLSTSGGNKVYAYNWDGVEKVAGTPITLAQWNLVQARLASGSVQVRVNGGSWVTTAAGAATSVSGTLKLGIANSAFQYFNGRQLETGLTNIALTDANFNDIRAYADTRYNQTGL